MAFVDEILSYKQSEEENFYKILGCDETATEEQICAEYKIRALSSHPDKNPSNVDAEDDFKKLQVAKEFLTDPVKRKKYDAWLNSGLAIPFKQWIARHEQQHSSMHWAAKKKKDLMLPGSENTVDESPLRRKSESATGQPVVWLRREDEEPDVSSTSSDLIRKFRSYEI